LQASRLGAAGDRKKGAFSPSKSLDLRSNYAYASAHGEKGENDLPLQRRSRWGSQEIVIVRIPILTGLGQSLRWLRDRQGKKQYQVADAAGITKGMLSAYETGRQRPSLETLEKILDTLGCDLNDLHNAVQIINGRPEKMRRREDALFGGQESYSEPAMAEGQMSIQGLLGRSVPLPEEEEKAFAEMLGGFHLFLRYLHGTLAQGLRRREPSNGGNTDH